MPGNLYHHLLHLVDNLSFKWCNISFQKSDVIFNIFFCTDIRPCQSGCLYRYAKMLIQMYMVSLYFCCWMFKCYICYFYVLIKCIRSSICLIHANVNSYFSAADIILWRRGRVTFGVIFGATMAWLLFEKSGLSFLTICCDIFLILILVQFLRVKIAGLLNR